MKPQTLLEGRRVKVIVKGTPRNVTWPGTTALTHSFVAERIQALYLGGRVILLAERLDGRRIAIDNRDTREDVVELNVQDNVARFKVPTMRLSLDPTPEWTDWFNAELAKIYEPSEKRPNKSLVAPFTRENTSPGQSGVVEIIPNEVLGTGEMLFLDGGRSAFRPGYLLKTTETPNNGEI